MKDILSYWGETLPLTVSIDDPKALKATLYLAKEGEAPTISKEVNFSNDPLDLMPPYSRIVDLTLSDEETRIATGEYNYQIVIDYSDGTVNKFPDPVPGSEESFPIITILPSLDMPLGA